MKNVVLVILAFGLTYNSSYGQDLKQLFRVHLNNNMYYTGIITERVANEHIVLISWGGDLMELGYDSIARFEQIKGRPSIDARILIKELYPRPKPSKSPATFQNHGYFGQLQYFTGYAHMGVTTVHGYKFNQYAHLGLGVGFDGVDRPISFRPNRFSDKHYNATGMHFQFLAHIGGDLLQKRATPYYALEIGYAYVVPYKSLIDLETREISPHAFSVATSFGVKFNSSKRYHTNVGLKLTYRAREMTFREVIFDEESNLYHLEFNKIMTSSWFFGLTVIQGFGGR
jgi:hypothetical protein